MTRRAEQYEARGNYVLAERLYRQVVEIDRRTHGPGHLQVAIDLSNLALAEQSLGDYPKAQVHARESVDIFQSQARDHPYLAKLLNNLAGISESSGDYAAAESLYRRALHMAGANSDELSPESATYANNLAYLYESLGDYARAESLYRRALEARERLLPSLDPDLAESLNNLAGVLLAKGDKAQAEHLYRRALRIRRRTLHPGSPAVAQSLNNLAWLHHASGNYARATVLYRQVLALRRRFLPQTHPLLASSLNNLATMHAATGQHRRARTLYRQALRILERCYGEEHPYVVGARYNLAGLAVAGGGSDEALRLMVSAEASNDRLIGQVFSIGSERQRASYLRTLRGYFDALTSLVVMRMAGVEKAVEAAFDVTQQRKGIEAGALAVQRDAILARRGPGLASKLGELRRVRAQLARLSLDGPGNADLAAHRREIGRWAARRERLEADLAHRIPQLKLESQVRTADRGSIAAALPTDAVLVEFVRFDVYDFQAVPARGEADWQPAHYAAFVLARCQPDRVTVLDLGPADALDEMIDDFRSALTGRFASQPDLPADRGSPGLRDALISRELAPEPRLDQAGNWVASGAALRSRIFDPLVPALAGHTRLFLAPDGNIARLPFDVLPLSADRELIDEYQISYLSVGRDLVRFNLRDTPPSNGGVATAALVIADPEFDVADDIPAPVPGKPFRRLPGTSDEGRLVADVLGVSPLLGVEAVKCALEGRGSPWILHLATHGFFLSDARITSVLGADADWSVGSGLGRLKRAGTLANPLLRSGLALAGANVWVQGLTPPECAGNGLLTAEDITGLDLSDTQLVVLSACDTGLGQVQVGEGVHGLQRAVVLSGARTLVMSLWKVPDGPTGELMHEFYRGLQRNEHRFAALRYAQRVLRAKYGHPLYWAAFILQGDPGPLLSRLNSTHGETLHEADSRREEADQTR